MGACLSFRPGVHRQPASALLPSEAAFLCAAWWTVLWGCLLCLSLDSEWPGEGTVRPCPPMEVEKQ